jgi:hypothetical protein
MVRKPARRILSLEGTFPGHCAASTALILAIEIIDCFFKSVTERKGIGAATAEAAAEQIIEDYQRVLKRGTLRLTDDGNDDAPLAHEIATPAN